MLALTEGTFALSNEEPTARQTAFTMPLKKLLFQALSLLDETHDSLNTRRFH